MFGSRIREPLDLAADSIIELGNDQNSQHPARASSVKVYPVALAAVAKYKPALIEAIDGIKFAAMYMKR